MSLECSYYTILDVAQAVGKKKDHFPAGGDGGSGIVVVRVRVNLCE